MSNISVEEIRKKRIVFTLITTVFAVVITVFIGEIFIRFASPVPYIFPRFQFSPQYGFTLYENRKMIHERPGKWQFTYTINSYQYRGTLIPISNSYDERNIVILGDSFSFGTGVNDGEEYAMIMAKELKGHFNIVNLGVSGWGLTQEIRRYYEFGQLYAPSIVILQFCLNDLSDNLTNLVTTVENGRFVFHDSDNTVNLVKRYLSDSFTQKSQIYNLFRNGIYEYFTVQVVNTRKQKMAIDQRNGVPIEQNFYNTLLETFAGDLRKKNIQLLMISVNNQLRSCSYIREKVEELEAKGRLRYHEVADWLQDVGEYGSPEGHEWGQKAHRIIGLKLAEIIRNGS